MFVLLIGQVCESGASNEKNRETNIETCPVDGMGFESCGHRHRLANLGLSNRISSGCGEVGGGLSGRSKRRSSAMHSDGCVTPKQNAERFNKQESCAVFLFVR